ncbi:hypothetical protein D3C73_896630 [compost metagenome]
MTGRGRLGRALRIGGEAFDRAGDPPQRLQHQEGEGRVEQPPRHRRDQQRHGQAVDQEALQLLLERLGRGQDLDQVARAVAGRGLDPQRAVGMAEQGLPGVQQAGAQIAAAQVDQVGRARQVGGLKQQSPHPLFADDDRLHPADAQQLFGGGVLDGGIGQGLDPDRGQFGRLQPIHQPPLLEGGGAGHDDQGGHRQGEDRRQQQQAAGQAVRGARPQPLRPAGPPRGQAGQGRPGGLGGRADGMRQLGGQGLALDHGASARRRARISFCVSLSSRGSSMDRKATPIRGQKNSANRLRTSGFGSEIRTSCRLSPIQQ